MRTQADKQVTLDHLGDVHVEVKRRTRRVFNDSLVLTARLSRPSTTLDKRRKLINVGAIACLGLFVYLSALGLGQGKSSRSRPARHKSSQPPEETSTQQFLPPKHFPHTPKESIHPHAPVVAGASFAYQEIKQGLSNIATKHLKAQGSSGKLRGEGRKFGEEVREEEMDGYADFMLAASDQHDVVDFLSSGSTGSSKASRSDHRAL
uniref:Uncharacterized protein n=1 Tax=Hanusia phi TaxID=3032 RepID=A0A7S0HVJ6_9CRYP|mmetsp:Transcript_36815/g.82991  ORF Transcript_36815/g.82991 Transcript_36815/m.82991 type:complete len:206 (+) Transcript_36815:241-858(+)